jgi:hypothetical protein
MGRTLGAVLQREQERQRTLTMPGAAAATAAFSAAGAAGAAPGVLLGRFTP